jgi:hypothetical protein
MKLVEVVALLSKKYLFDECEAMEYIKENKPKKVKLVVEVAPKRKLPESITNIPKKKRKSAPIRTEPASIKQEPAPIRQEPASIKQEPASIKQEPASIKRKSIMKRYKRGTRKRVHFEDERNLQEHVLLEVLSELVREIVSEKEEEVVEMYYRVVERKEEVFEKETQSLDQSLEEYVPPLDLYETNDRFPLLLK